MAQRIQPENLVELSFVSDPALSPDGEQCLAVLSRILPGKDGEPPRYRRRVYLFEHGPKAAEPRPFTLAEADSFSPRWSPDGARVALLSTRGESDQAQLFVIPANGGEAERLSDLASGVTGFCWRPDGQAIALVSRGGKPAKDTDSGRTIDRLYYKTNGSGLRPDEPAQLFLLELASNVCTRLTAMACDVGDPVWTPEGALLFTSARDADEEARWQSRLWRLEPGGAPAELMLAGPTRVAQPQPSPSGRRIAFFARLDEDNFATPLGLWTVNADGSDPVLQSGDLEAVPAIAGDSRYGSYPNRAAWLDEETLLFNANTRGRSGVHQLELASNKLTALQRGDRAVTSFSAVGDRFAFTAETPATPGELFLWRGGHERALSAVNRAFVTRYRLSPTPEEQRARVKDGNRVAYWRLAPAQAREDGALVLQIHGGPHTCYGYGFMFEFQLLASKGYTVVYGNPRGSSSYGADYATTVQGRFGSVDADDLLAVLRDAKRQHNVAGAPVHLTGGSYGGFMTNWLVAHTKGFRSAVTQRSICNWLSFYGSSDIGYRFTERELGGNPWDDLDTLWAQSPLKYVRDIDTPLLIIHAEEDHRCPVEQAEQLFVALKRLGKTTRMLRVPGENHELSRSGRPDRRVLRLESMLEWFEAHA